MEKKGEKKERRECERIADVLLPLLRLDPPNAQLPVIEGGLGVREGGGGVPGRRGSGSGSGRSGSGSSGSCSGFDRHRRRG